LAGRDEDGNILPDRATGIDRSPKDWWSNMHGTRESSSPRKLPWWKRWNEFPNPTLDALLAVFGLAVILAVLIYVITFQ
jgi:hypothetical protein